MSRDRRGLHIAVALTLGSFALSTVGAQVTVTDTRTTEKGLLAHWRFDEGSGEEAKDSSDNGNDGEIFGAEWVKGKFGSALHFGGRDAYVSIPEIGGLEGSNEMSVEAWVYWEGTGRYPNILTGGRWNPGGFLIFVSDNGCSFRMGKPGDAPWNAKDWTETSAGFLQFSLGQWYHLAATFKRPLIRTYVDGALVGSANWDYPVGFSGGSQIGSWGSPEACHKGLIDEVRVYSRALAAEEVKASYEKEAGKRMTATSPAEEPYEKVVSKTKPPPPAVTLENQLLRLTMDSKARVLGLVEKATGRDYGEKPFPYFAIVRKGGREYKPSSCSYRDSQLAIEFGRAAGTVVMRVGLRKQYFVFQVASVSSKEVEELTFLNVRVKPSKYRGWMSGMVGDDDFAFCVRVLNLQTNANVSGTPPALSAACSREYGLTGAGAALIGCPRRKLRAVLKEVVRKEGLPYSPLGGPFALDAEETRGSYLFSVVSEKNVEEWIELARRGGFAQIHLCPWWRTLGHYEPNPDLFPHGLEGVKAVVEKIHAAGFRVGMHTLTGCISVNDPWVTPVPDKRLTKDASFTLAAPINSADKAILTVERPQNLETFWSDQSTGNTLQIGDEIIAYTGISQQPPYSFTGCTRGHWGTKAAPHEKGAAVHHLVASYCSYIPDENTTLLDELAEGIANVFNTCGFDMIYMDGAEGMRSWHAVAKMRTAIFSKLKRRALVEASEWGYHSWPFHSRIGAWDHPMWGFNRFTDLHCTDLQRYRATELLPGQLGWWVITGPSQDWPGMFPEEMEYFCGKALGWDAPMSLEGVAAGQKPPNARQDEYLTMLGRYERLRLARYFNESVRAKLQAPKEEFRLGQADTGEWELVPTDYSAHKVTALTDGSSTWTLNNRFRPQPLKLRIEALYSCAPYDSPDSIVIADLSKPEEFSLGQVAGNIVHGLDLSSLPQPLPVEGRGACFTAKSGMAARRGAWVKVGKVFSPPLDMSKGGALGIWVYGDGKGELLNFQLNNSREYYTAWDDHYVTVDFKGWRYFELLLRERDAQRHQDYVWPYGGACEVGRTPLLRGRVGAFNLYYNELPPGEEVKCYFSPIKALPVVRVKLTNPAIAIGGKRLAFPVALESGQYIEFESPTNCRLYDERGAVVQQVTPEGDVPTLAEGENRAEFTCAGPDGYRARAKVTVITQGKPLRGVAPKERVDWHWLRTECDDPRIIQALDGKQNEWDVLFRPDAKDANLQVEIAVERMGQAGAGYDSTQALTVDSFDNLSRFADTPDNQFAKYVYDSEHRSIADKPGVTHKLEQSFEVTKVGKFSVRYTAASKREDDAGWCAQGERFAPTLDLSKFSALGFWIHGDRNGEYLKLQLRDTAGLWQDMVTQVDFTGWRYVEFELGSEAKIDLSKIEYLILYYNSIPAGKVVTCYVDDIRALREAGVLRSPTIAVGGRKVAFPVSMSIGERLVYGGTSDCRLYARDGAVKETVKPTGDLPALKPGRTRVRFELGGQPPSDFQVRVLMAKVYRQ